MNSARYPNSYTLHDPVPKQIQRMNNEIQLLSEQHYKNNMAGFQTVIIDALSQAMIQVNCN